MLLSKKEQYFKIISEKENQKFFNGFISLCRASPSLINSNSDSNVTLMSIIILIMFYASSILGLFFSISSFFFIFGFIYQEEYILAIVSFLDGISFIVTFLGCLGKVKCFCLYRPYQWIFFMLFFDLIHIVSDMVIMASLTKSHSLSGDLYGYFIFGYLGSFGYSIAFMVMHCKIGGKLIILFKYLKNLETNVIKFCVFEYIKELKNNQVLNKDN